MGRMIDADAIRWDKCEDADGNPVYVLDKRDIDVQPTAYDPDKVVKQLEDCSMWKELLVYEMTHREREIVKRAIEIVKGGGVND